MTASAEQDYGFATGLAAQASKDAQGNAASNVNDGDDSTRWYDGDNVTDGNWVMIDLGEERDIGKVRLNWGEDTGVYPQAYKIQAGSPDGGYLDLYESQTPPASPVEEYEVTGRGQYVRLLVVKHGTWGTSLYEFNVWEAKDQPDQPDQPQEPDVSGNNIVKLEAEGAVQEGTEAQEMPNASGGAAVTGLYTAGSRVTFKNLPAGDCVTVCYSSPQVQEEGRIGLYINGVRTDLPTQGIPDPGSFRESTIAAQIPENAVLSIQYDEGDVPLWVDYIRIPGTAAQAGEDGRYEAENGMLIQGDLYQPGVAEVAVRELASASGGSYVDGFLESGDGAGVMFPGIISEDGAYELRLGYARYFYEQTDKIGIYINGVKKQQLDLVSQGSNVDDTILSKPMELELKQGDTIAVRVDAAAGEGGKLRMDYLKVQPVKDTPVEEEKEFSEVVRVMAGDRLRIPVTNLPEGESLLNNYETI